MWTTRRTYASGAPGTGCGPPGSGQIASRRARKRFRIFGAPAAARRPQSAACRTAPRPARVSCPYLRRPDRDDPAAPARPRHAPPPPRARRARRVPRRGRPLGRGRARRGRAARRDRRRRGRRRQPRVADARWPGPACPSRSCPPATSSASRTRRRRRASSPSPGASCTDDAAALAGVRTAVLVLDGVQDPGNVGAVIRSAAWFGVDAVVMDARSADPEGPKAVRASMGGLWDVALVRVPDLGEALGALAAAGVALWGADMGGTDAAAWAPPAPDGARARLRGARPLAGRRRAPRRARHDRARRDRAARAPRRGPRRASSRSTSSSPPASCCTAWLG